MDFDFSLRGKLEFSTISNIGDIYIRGKDVSKNTFTIRCSILEIEELLKSIRDESEETPCIRELFAQK